MNDLSKESLLCNSHFFITALEDILLAHMSVGIDFLLFLKRTLVFKYHLNISLTVNMYEKC
jgi:hypothetical protein